MRTVLLYLALVGLPLLGVLAILHVGRGLAAPTAFDGTWALAPAGAPPGACALPTAPLVVVQSGRRAQVGFGAATVGAAVEGVRLRTRAPLAAGGGCAGWRVEAEAVGGAVPDGLAGRLVPEGGAGAPVPFRATRLSTAAPAAAGH